MIVRWLTVSVAQSVTRNRQSARCATAMPDPPLHSHAKASIAPKSTSMYR